MKNALSHLVLSVGVVLPLFALGCTGTLPQRYPSRPPTGMTVARAEGDERECLGIAGRATSERAWAYIGCMVAKGHTVGVAFHVQNEATYMGVTQTRPHDGAAVAREVENCRRSAYAAGRAGGSSRDGIVDRMEGAFRTCLDPLGYTVQRDGAPTPGRSGS
jgi:hypothetical protein